MKLLLERYLAGKVGCITQHSRFMCLIFEHKKCKSCNRGYEMCFILIKIIYFCKCVGSMSNFLQMALSVMILGDKNVSFKSYKVSLLLYMTIYQRINRV